MKHPKLKEVKKHFENAKTIRLVNSHVEIEVNPELFKKNKFGVNEYGSNGELLETKNSFHCVYGKSDRKYAEILTYKEKTFSITESQINNLKKDIKNGYHVDAIDYLEKLFPETIKSKVKELKIGTWYNYNGSIVNYQGIENGILQAYGIRYSDKDWMNSSPMGSSPQKWVEATEQEVFEALKNEAVKRGFKQGAFIKYLFKPNCGSLKQGYDKNECSDEEFIITEFGLFVGNLCIFHKGKWAEIIETITLSEAEQQLKKKIIV